MKSLASLFLGVSTLGAVTTGTVVATQASPMPASEQCQVIVRPEGWTPDLAYTGKYCDASPAAATARG